MAAVNTKGGIGKTTLASVLAARAAKDSPRVAMVDLDPQRSLVEWWQRRGSTENPAIFEGADSPVDAVEALALDGWDYVFLDGPPALLLCMEQALSVSTFAIVPARASLVDLIATTDVLAMAEAAGVPHVIVLNAVPPAGKSGNQAQAELRGQKAPMARTIVHQRQSYVAGLNAERSAAEVNACRDKAAASEIDALRWEVKAAAKTRARARRWRIISKTTTDRPLLIEKLKSMGFVGVQNYPTVGIFDGVIRQNLEETGMGFDREVEVIRVAHELDLLTCPYVFNEDEAKAMVEAGADVLVPHVGVTSSGHAGAKTIVSLDAAAARIQSMLDAARTVREYVLVLCHGGPVAEPPDVAYVMEKVRGLDGFLGGSSMDRLPAERAITEQVRRFKAIVRALP